MLVAEADVVGIKREAKLYSFIVDLEPKDLERLRAVTRRGAAKSGLVLTNEQCDDVIARLGPDLAMEHLRGLPHANDLSGEIDDN